MTANNYAGTELRNLRKEQAYTLADIAEKAGVSVMYLSEIERNKKVPSDELMAKLADIYGINKSVMFEKFGRVSEDMLEELTNNSNMFHTLFGLSRGKISEERKLALYEEIHTLYTTYLKEESQEEE